MKRIFSLALILSVWFFTIGNVQAAETIAITTYYPSPVGIYQTLRLFPVSTIVPAGPCSNRGEMAYDSNTNNVYLCNGNWALFASSGGDVGWIFSDPILYSDDPASPADNWLIGIGRQNPQAKFHIDPDPAISSDDFFITADGSVGVGTSSTLGILDITNSNAAVGTIGFFDKVNNNRDMWYGAGTDHTFYFTNTAGEAGKFIFGRVSAGVTVPTLSFVNEGSGGAYIGTGSPGSGPYFALRVTDNVRVNLQPSSGEYVVFENLPSGTINTPLCWNGTFVGTVSSCSKRYKKDIVDLEIDAAKIYNLRPVSFTWKEQNTRDFGLIAEEVAEALPQLATYNQDGAPESVKYQQLSVLLLAELKKLKSWADDLEAQISELENN